MSDRFGIHMGNSTMCLSVLKEGKIDIVASKFGDRISYAVVSAADEDELILGLPAKQGLVRNGPLSVVNNLQFLNENLTDDEFDECCKNCVCNINKEPLEYILSNGEISRTITPYEVAVKLLTNSFENASQAAKSEINHEAVVAVPIDFSLESRKNFGDAAKEAGFDVLQMISEPSAALLAYEIGFDLTEKFNVMVYRIGGLTSDITILKVENGMYEEIDHCRLKIGGNLLTKALADYMAKEFYQKYKLDPRESRRTMIKVAQHAESCKHILSTLQSAHIFIESLMDGVDWSQNISRARFENVIASHLSMFMRPMEELTAKYSDISIDKIILCGGTMKVPKIKSTISSMYPHADILDSIPGDEVFSIGCARQAMFVKKSWDPFGEHVDMEVSTLSEDVSIDNADIERKCLFSKGTVVPTEGHVPVRTVDGQITMDVHQGDRVDVLNHKLSIPINEDLTIRAKVHLGHGDKNTKINFIFPLIKETLIE